MVVASPARRHQLVADAMSIDEQFIQPMARHIDSRALNAAMKLEITSKHRRYPGLAAGMKGRRYPVSAPLRRREQSHFPVRDSAPAQVRAAFIPYAYLPEIACAAVQRGTAVSQKDGLTRVYFS